MHDVNYIVLPCIVRGSEKLTYCVCMYVHVCVCACVCVWVMCACVYAFAGMHGVSCSCTVSPLCTQPRHILHKQMEFQLLN